MAHWTFKVHRNEREHFQTHYANTCIKKAFHFKVSAAISKMERLETFLKTWVCTQYMYVGLICLETLTLTANQRLFIVLSGNLHTFEHIFLHLP